MTSDLDIHDLARHVAVMEKSMETLKAEQESALDRLRADMANWKTDMVKRDKDNQRWTITLVLGCTALVIGAVALFS